MDILYACHGTTTVLALLTVVYCLLLLANSSCLYISNCMFVFIKINRLTNDIFMLHSTFDVHHVTVMFAISYESYHMTHITIGKDEMTEAWQSEAMAWRQFLEMQFN